MGRRRLYRQPVESARHEQFKKLCLEYFSNQEKLMNNPSMRFATRARKALINIRKVALPLGLELLSLYAPSMNEGKDTINPFTPKNSSVINKYNHTRDNPNLENKKE
tara:strand:- start:3025 stop:3345 length:321 start_codon:yes stop_codon:yes gene_type:complete